MNNRERVSLVKAHERALAKGKAAYQEAEEIFDHLKAGTAVGEVITIKPRALNTPIRQVVIHDNFAESNKAFKAAMVSRYVLKDVKQTDIKPKRLVIERPHKDKGQPTPAAAPEDDQIPGL